MESGIQSEITQLLKTSFVQNVLQPLILTIGSFFFGKACIFIAQFLLRVYKHNVKPLWKKYTLLEKYGEYVVITNAGDPLGIEFAKIFAEHGHSLILIKSNIDARLEADLHKIRKFMESDKGRVIRIINVEYDLGDHMNYEKVEKLLEKEEIKGKIGILLNNAGVGTEKDDSFLNVSSMHLLLEVHRSVVDFLMITKSVLKIMVQNGKGLIVNITTPSNNRTVTEGGFPYAMRLFTEEFNKIVRRELSICDKDAKVKVVAVNPGHICVDKNCCPDIFNPTPQEFVKSAFKVLGRADSSTGYWYYSVQNFFRSFIPMILTEYIDRMNRKTECIRPQNVSEYTPIP